MHVCLEKRLACLCRMLWPICSLQPCSVSFAAFLQTVDELIGYYRGPACRLLLIYNNLFELWVVQSYSTGMWFLWSKELWMLCTLLLIRLSLFLSVRWARLFVIRKAKETHRVLILRGYSKYLHIPLNSLKNTHTGSNFKDSHITWLTCLYLNCRLAWWRKCH